MNEACVWVTMWENEWMEAIDGAANQPFQASGVCLLDFLLLCYRVAFSMN